MMMHPAKEFRIGDLVEYIDAPDLVRDRSPDVPQWRVAEIGRLTALDAPGVALANAGFQSYRPVEFVTRRCGPLRKTRTWKVPALCQYLFVNVRAEDMPRACAASIGGVPALRGFLGVDGRSPVIPSTLVEDFRVKWSRDEVDQDALRAALPVLKPGEPVRVRHGSGPMEGFVGVVSAVIGDRARIMTALFGRSAPLEVDLLDLETV